MQLPEDIIHKIWKTYYTHIVLHELQETVNTILSTIEVFQVNLELIIFDKPVETHGNNKYYLVRYNTKLCKCEVTKIEENFSHGVFNRTFKDVLTQSPKVY
tara:strand:- start:3160 stop:3462 length:303 start_codon:yes stop_codon:yes gene_type:complete